LVDDCRDVSGIQVTKGGSWDFTRVEDGGSGLGVDSRTDNGDLTRKGWRDTHSIVGAEGCFMVGGVGFDRFGVFWGGGVSIS
jgi:hypothetical protein